MKNNITKIFGLILCASVGTLLAGIAHADEPALKLPFMDSPSVKTETSDFISARRLPDCSSLAPPVEALELINAIHHALCNNPDTRIAWEMALAQEAQIGVSRAPYFPELSLSGNATTSRSAVQNTKPGYAASGGPSISIGYLLYDFGAREATFDASQENAFTSLFMYYDAVQKVVINTIRAYYSLQSAIASLDAAQKTLSYNKLAQEIAQQKHEVGSSPIADRLQADTVVAQAQLTLETFRQQVELQRGALARAMGLPPQTPLMLPASTHMLFHDDVANRELEDMVREALKNRPDILAAGSDLRAAEAQLRGAEALDYPTVSMTMSHGAIQNTRPNNYHQNDSVAMVSMSIPLFTGYKNTYSRRAARHQLEAQEATRKQLEQDAGLDVWNNYQNYRTANNNIPLADRLVESAYKSNEVALGRYKEGVGTILDVLNAQDQLSSALVQQINARYALQVERANLAQAMGLLYQSFRAP